MNIVCERVGVSARFDTPADPKPDGDAAVDDLPRLGGTLGGAGHGWRWTPVEMQDSSPASPR